MRSLLLALILCLCTTSAALAGEYHTAAKGLICADCHTMHNFENNQPVVIGGPFPHLLKAATQLQLCMSCHDGRDPTAPDIVAAGTSDLPNNVLSTAYSSPYKNAGGFFQSDWATKSTSCGHNLHSNGALQAPGGSWTSGATGMVCSDCHNIHGNAYYRNLLPNPGGNVNVPIVLGTDVTENTAVTLPPSANPALAYNTDNVHYLSKMSEWCAGCHTDYSAGHGIGSLGNHPSDVALNASYAGLSGTTSLAADELYGWTNGTAGGFDPNPFPYPVPGSGLPSLENGVAGIARLPYQGTLAIPQPDQSNSVFCLSCHKAHGSQYTAAMPWPYSVSNPTANQSLEQNSGCQQCHNL